jgi:hypothetical protein
VRSPIVVAINLSSIPVILNRSTKIPLCRVVPLYDNRENNGRANYNKEKYREMIFDAAETVLGYFGFDRTLYGDKKNISKRKWWWMQELRQEKDIKIEMSKASKAMSFYSHNCYCSLTASQSFQLSHGISTNHHKKHCISA